MSAAPRIEEMEKEPGTAVTQGQPTSGLRTIEDDAPVSGAQLLMRAIDANLPVEAIERFVALHERMEKKEAEKRFSAAMAAFQQECPSIKRAATAKIETKSGGKYSYTYAPIDEIARTANPILAKHGLSYNWDFEVSQNAVKVVCTVRHSAGHSLPSSILLPIDNPNAPALSPQQKVEAAMSIGQRRTLASALGLTTTDQEAPAAELDQTQISEDQAIVIDDLITEIGVDRTRFLKYLGVPKVSDILAADYRSAIAALEEKRGKSQGVKS